MYNYNGCKAPKKDIRDYKLSKAAYATRLPEEFTLTPTMKVKNQGGVCSCVAHATSSILEYHAQKQKSYDLLSTNFIYGAEYHLFAESDFGMHINNACKIVTRYGDVLETDCPGNTEVTEVNDIAKAVFDDEDKLQSAQRFRMKSYYSCNSIEKVKQAVYSHGPVLASIKWYNNFEPDEQYVLTGKEEGDFGYHAIIIYGWTPEGFVCQNSWGKDWGKDGRFILPYSFKLAEAKGFIDVDEDSCLTKPPRNTIFDFFYKLINIIINMFNK